MERRVSGPVADRPPEAQVRCPQKTIDAGTERLIAILAELKARLPRI